MNPSWLEQLFGNPTALFAALAFLAAATAAVATAHYARTTRRMQLDASNPRLAISVGNVGWTPVHPNVLGQIVNPPPQREWAEALPGDLVQKRPFDDYHACHTIARLRNDGAATAHVRWTVLGGGSPRWSPNSDTIFRVTSEEFTVPPMAQIDVDLYPGLSADRWSDVADSATIVWTVEVRGQSLPQVTDTTTITWAIVSPVVGDIGRRVWSDSPERSCSVAGWSRRYRSD